MKKVLLFMVMVMAVSLLNPIAVLAEELKGESNSRSIAEVIPKEATAYAYSAIEDIKDLAEIYKKELEISKSDFENIKFAKPYVIMDLDKETQDEIYYYPMVDSNGEVLLVVSIMGALDGWSMSFSCDMVKDLNKIDYEKNDYIFVESDDNVVVLDENIAIPITGEVNETIKFFLKEDIDTRLEEVIDTVQTNFVETDCLEVQTDTRDTYTRAFDMNKSDWKVCSLYQKQGQGNYGMCWAASTATIVNYIKGTSYTGKDVCKKMGIGYNEGATIRTSQLAINKYGVEYNVLRSDINNQMNWSTIKKNINNKYPIYISSGNSSGDGHAVTIFGYQVKNSKNYVWIWNSGLNEGKGLGQIVEYKKNSTVFTYDNATFYFRKSVSKY